LARELYLKNEKNQEIKKNCPPQAVNLFLTKGTWGKGKSERVVSIKNTDPKELHWGLKKRGGRVRECSEAERAGDRCDGKREFAPGGGRGKVKTKGGGSWLHQGRGGRFTKWRNKNLRGGEHTGRKLPTP